MSQAQSFRTCISDKMRSPLGSCCVCLLPHKSARDHCVCVLCLGEDCECNQGKQLLCQCGCHGWCTLWVLLDLVKWDLNNAAKNSNPLKRHDGTDFDEDSYWLNLHQTKPGFVLAVTEIRGDWLAIAEFCLQNVVP